MKRRINELLKGKFIYESEKPTFSHEKIVGNVMENEVFQGRFQIKSPASVSMRGIVYSTNPRIGFKPETFSGFQERFLLEADTTGLLHGDAIEGEFVFQTSLGEYHLPYHIGILSRDTGEDSFDMSLADFAELAKADFNHGYSIFRSAEFQRNLKNWGSRYQNLYRGLCDGKILPQSLEEFLIGSKMKEPVTLFLETDHMLLHNINEVIREEITIRREQWGFAELEITSDSDFLSIEHPHVTTDDFVGNSYQVSFMVHQEKLHSGHNHAKIQISYGYRTLSAEVEIINDSKYYSENNVRRQHQEIARMETSYLSYRTGKTLQKDWIAVTLDAIMHYRQFGGSHIFVDLYELYIQLLIRDMEKAQELQKLISEKKMQLKDPSWYGIYLYLTAKLNPNPNYQELMKDHILTLYLEHQENWILQLLMFYANEHLIKNITEKMNLIRRQYQCGCNSPILFLEGYEILKKEPLMLRSLGAYEVHLLQFLCRENLLDPEICGQTAQLACRLQEFDPVLFRILCKCYEAYPSHKMLTAICTMLINGRHKDAASARWYELGIQKDVRITGIYEYYVETMRYRKDSVLPKSVRLYFVYHNVMGYLKKAQIFANIIQHKADDPDTYEQYYSAMELFAEEQAQAGHINSDLAVIYRDIMRESLLTQAIAEGMQRILFACEVKNPHKDLQELIVLREEFEMPQRVVFRKEQGNVQLYGSDAVILAKDSHGRCYACPEDITFTPLYQDPELEMACKKLLKNPAAILLHECYRDGVELRITSENVNAYLHVLEIEGLKDKYAIKVRSALITYFSQHDMDRYLPVFLMMEETKEPILEKKGEWITILAAEDRYEKIYELISVNGYEKVPVPILVRMCSCLITKWEYPEDKMMLAVASYSFHNGCYDEVMLRFLMKYYEGPIETMKKIWISGTNYGLESFELEERILLCCIFTMQYLDNTEEIFKSYVLRSGKRFLCTAYTMLMSYEYFVRSRQANDFVMEYVEKNENSRQPFPDVSEIALMQYYTSLPKLDEVRRQHLYQMASRYIETGMTFSFLKKLPQDMQEKLQIHDKFIVEFRHKPQCDVMLHYQLNESEIEKTKIMKEIFEGVYTSEFTLFYGETLTWFFEYWDEKGAKRSDVQTDIFVGSIRKHAISKYDLINRMLMAKDSGSEEEFAMLKAQYIEQQHLVDELFLNNENRRF